jgi:hypothetical protein
VPTIPFVKQESKDIFNTNLQSNLPKSLRHNLVLNTYEDVKRR